jgi:hypothetical protein
VVTRAKVSDVNGVAKQMLPGFVDALARTRAAADPQITA